MRPTWSGSTLLPSTSTRSIATGGRIRFMRSCFGSTMTTPLAVPNHIRPSLVRHAGVCEAPLACCDSMPSFLPYQRGSIFATAPRSSASMSAHAKRAMPRFELTQKWPSPSSSMANTASP